MKQCRAARRSRNTMKRRRGNAFVHGTFLKFPHRSPSQICVAERASYSRGPVSELKAANYVPSGISRRAVISTAALACAGQILGLSRCDAEEYDAMTTRRYVDSGRPTNSGIRPPAFDAKIKTFAVSDALQAQDIKVGTGPEVQKGTLVQAQWVITLVDGSIVDDTSSSGSVVFRVGAGQVASGIEKSVLGMKSGGSRVVKGPSSTFFSDITSGERTLVPKDSEVYMDILVQQLDPYSRK